jgi:hypothetical protein
MSAARRRRADAGPWVTERDARALAWIGEQYAVRGDVLQALLGRLSPIGDSVGARTVRKQVDRWEEAGWAERRWLFRRAWLVPTAKGMRAGALEYPAWDPKPSTLAHVHAVSIVRLYVEADLPPGARWVSERELRREDAELHSAGRRGVTRFHPFDGAVEDAPSPEGYPGRAGVEVELTLKDPKRFREIVEQTQSQQVRQLVYFAPPSLVPVLTRWLHEAKPKRPTGIHPLPDVPGVAYEEGF